MGGIYTLGVSPGTRLRYNVIHDVKARAYGGWGIYPDEGSSEIVIENNLVYRCSSSPFFTHINRKITVQNDIFAFGEQCQVERAGATSGPEQEYAFLRNLVYYRQEQLVGYWNAQNRMGEEFFSLEGPEVARIQKAYLEKMVDTLNDLDNILWEICSAIQPCGPHSFRIIGF